MNAVIPPGYRFVPTDQELIQHYLLRRAMGLPLPPNNLLLEKNVYAAHPYDVFRDVDESFWETTECKNTVKMVTYTFTKLSKIHMSKSRVARTAGCGTWKGQNSKKIHDDDSEQEIGFMRMLTFQSKKEGDNHDHWNMNEYSLSGVSLNFEIQHEDYVICKITRTVSKDKYNRDQKQGFYCGSSIEKRSFEEIQEDVPCDQHKRQKFDHDQWVNSDGFEGQLAPLEQLSNDFANWEQYVADGVHVSLGMGLSDHQLPLLEENSNCDDTIDSTIAKLSFGSEDHLEVQAPLEKPDEASFNWKDYTSLDPFQVVNESFAWSDSDVDAFLDEFRQLFQEEP